MVSNTARIQEPDYDDPKEIYAFYGLAAYFAQCVEQSIILFLLVLRASGVSGIKGNSHEEILANLDKDTMGTLIKQLRRVTNLEPNFAAHLNELLPQRNYLVHHFFLKNIAEIQSVQGRRTVIDELRGIAQAFKDADHILEALYEPLYAKFGIDQERIESELDKMRANTV